MHFASIANADHTVSTPLITSLVIVFVLLSAVALALVIVVLKLKKHSYINSNR